MLGVPIASAELYDPSTGTFTATSSMNAARADHTATLLTDGRVLIAGGLGCDTANGCTANNQKWLASAELYDPATGLFSITGSMTFTEAYHTATRLNDGRVLLAAGGLGGKNNAQLYDAATGMFTTTGAVHGDLGSFGDTTANLLPDGRVLVIGRADAAPSAQAYDPVTGEFADLPFKVPGAIQKDLSPTLTSTLLPNGLVLLSVSPTQQSSNGRTYGGYLETYDPTTGAFKSAGSVSNPYGASISVLLDGRVLFTGGSSSGTPSTTVATIYDPSTGARTAIKLLVGRVEHTATVLADGRVLVAGGLPKGEIGLGDSTPKAFASAELFQP